MAVAVIGVTFFDSTPLPGTESVRFSPDFAWAISIAAEAKHHWPIEDPSISGETFPYHYFVHIHWAAASQVTGIDLSTIFSRLWILPLTVLLVLELVVAGTTGAPMTYMHERKQYIVVAVGGRDRPPEWVALSLP